ncbi:MAG: hypothetical protein ACO3O0_06105 [Bacteroidia bacterium]
MVQAKQILGSILLLFIGFQSYGQSGVRDTIIRFPFLNVSFGYYQPGGDLADRFGSNSMLGGEVLYKDKRNFVYGFSTGFIFGDQIKEPKLMSDLYTPEQQIIGLDGLYAEIRIFERGYHFGPAVGKIFSFKKPNPNSGIMLLVSPGFLQHKIRIEDIGNTVPALRGDYKKGYDRLTNGFRLQEFIGFVYFSNRQLANFYAGFEFIQGFTQLRRDYVFDDQAIDRGQRLDLMYGFKLGWTMPLYKKKPKAFYFY